MCAYSVPSSGNTAETSNSVATLGRTDAIFAARRRAHRRRRLCRFGQAKEGRSRPSTPLGGGETRRNEGGPFSTGAVLQGIFGSTPTPRPYNLIISMSERNVINHNNPGAIIGNITSPLFGRANQPVGSRDLG